jgi:CHAT domain-containing protein
MKIVIKTFYLLIILLLSSCIDNSQKEKHIEKKIQEIEINTKEIVEDINRNNTIFEVLSNGGENIVYARIEDSLKYYSQDEKLALSKTLFNFGLYNFSMEFLNNVNVETKYFDKLIHKFNDAISLNDVQLAALLLDTLSNHLKNNYSIVNETRIEISKGYLNHVLSNYSIAIKHYKKAFYLINKFKLSDFLKISVYRKIGNSYNNMAHIEIHNDEYFKQALYYYGKEQEVTLNMTPISYTNLSMNNIITGVLMRCKNKSQLPYFQKAIDQSIVYSDSNATFTINAVTATMALNNYIEKLHYKYDVKSLKKIDSLIKIHKSIIFTKSLISLYSGLGIDVKEYYSQFAIELEIQNKINNPLYKIKPLELLNLSQETKYPLIKHIKKIKETYGDYYSEVLKLYITLLEIKAFAIKNNNKKYVAFANKNIHKLKNLNETNFNFNYKVKLTKSDVNKLISYCKKTKATIIDYQILYGNKTIYSFIDEHGLKVTIDSLNPILSSEDIDTLYKSLENRNVSNYQKNAFNTYKRLYLDKINTKNIIICSDEIIEKIPFDALVIDTLKKQRWKDLNYLIKSKDILLIPSLTMLLEKQTENKLFVNVWYTEKDTSTLPFNNQLINWIKDNLGTKINNPKLTSSGILHIIGHTVENEKKQLEYHIGKFKLTNKSNLKQVPQLVILHGCKSNNGKYVKSEGILSLSRMFLYNGSNSVISSLWDVDNKSSTELFKLFYSELKKGKNTNESMRIAKKKILFESLPSEWSNPYYWSSFNSYGNSLNFD